MEGLGVRKGGWTREEDTLLRKYVEKYGEEKWHLVPLRAGLSRCRKSCRLRWLNYLKPNIKRGKFASDEVDLMIRLHKLLGNRWSLIAGRLPGRTANDVKNYWHNHRFKKMVSIQEKGKDKAQAIISKSTVVKPKPCKPSKSLLGFTLKITAADAAVTQGTTSSEPLPTLLQPNQDILWWEGLLADYTNGDQELIARLLTEEIASAVDTNGGGFTLKNTAADAAETQGTTSSEPLPTLLQPNQDILWWESLLPDYTNGDQELIASLLTEETTSAVDTNGGGNYDFPFGMNLIGEVMI